MGLFTNFFKSKPDNIINEIAEILISNEKKNTLIKDSPFLKDKNITFNPEGIFSFVVAQLCYELETNPSFKSLKLKNQYLLIIEAQKDNKNFQLLAKNIDQYYRGEKTLVDLTYAYIYSVWKIDNLVKSSDLQSIPAMDFVRFKWSLRDPILLTTYSMVLSQFMENVSKYLLESIKELS